MPRIRTIKPEFWTSEQVIELSIPARLLFIGMWNFCDDKGVMPATPRSLKAKVLPADDLRVDDIKAMVGELIAHGLLIEFEANGERWWHVTGWKHQIINRPTKSSFPEPPCKAAPPSADDSPEDEESLRSPAHSTASDTARSPAHLQAAGVHPRADDAPGAGPLTEDSLSAHGGLTEDSSPERKGKERKGKERNSNPDISEQPEMDGGARGTRLSIRELPVGWRSFAQETRSDLDPDFCWQKFRDYWTAVPGAKGRKSDWLATWRNFIRSEHPRKVNGHAAHQQPQRRYESSPEQFARRIDERDARARAAASGDDGGQLRGRVYEHGEH